jgi:predicted permease
LLPFLDSVLRDIRLAFRTLAHSPAYTLVAIVSLALGIGANTAIFSFVNAILLKHLPVPEPTRLVTFAEVGTSATEGTAWRLNTVEQLAKRSTAFEGVFGWFTKPINFSRGESSHWVLGELVTGEYFQTLGVHAAQGRLLTDDDVRDAKANPVCVISYDFWQREFAGDPQAIGRTVYLNGHPYQVLGVTQRGFFGAALQRRADVQAPATRIGDFMPAFGDSTGVDWLKTLSWLTPMARLKPGVSRLEAQLSTQPIWHQIQTENSGGRASTTLRELRLLDGSQGLNGMRTSFGQPALVLLAVAGVVLLVTCANLANLLIARSQARAKEFAVRLSLGASRARVMQQLLVESLVLAAIGGAAGVLLSSWMTSALLAFLNAGRTSLTAVHVEMDGRVFGFSLALSLATALLFGAGPAWQATSRETIAGLRQRGGVLRKSLVVLQLVLSLTVIFAAGLLTQTLRSLQTVDLGFAPQKVIAMAVDPEANGRTHADATRILDELLQRVRALPGVKAASLASSTPYGASAISFSVQVPGYTVKAPGDDVADFNFITPGYFATLEQPFLRGRDFTASDDGAHARVAIVNKSFGRRYLGSVDPIGRKFRQGGGDLEIVGVVKDARDRALRTSAGPGVYLPTTQGQTSGLTLLVRADENPTPLIPSLLAIVQSIDRHMPVYSVHTLDTQIEAGLSSERILGYLSGMFAGLATLLAGIGLYGVVAYSVVRRTREIGIRISTGAQRHDIGILFARETLWLIGMGLLIGMPVALMAVRVLKTLLFGVGAGDRWTLVVSMAALFGAAAIATMLPLWRAMRISPITALRYE